MTTKKYKKNKKQKRNKSSYKSLWKIIGYSKYAKFWLALVIFFGILSMGALAVVPYFNAQLTVSIVEFDKINSENIYKFVIIAFCLEIIVTIVSFCWGVTSRYMNAKFFRKVYYDLSKQFAKIKANYIDTTNNGAFVSRFNSDISSVVDYFDSTLDRILEILSKIVVVVYILSIHLYFGLIVLAITLLSTIIYHFEKKIRIKTQKIISRKNQEVVGLINEYIRGIRDVKLLNFSQTIVDNLDEKIAGRDKFTIKWQSIISTMRRTRGLLGGLSYFIVVIVAVLLIMQGDILIPTTIVVLSYVKGFTNFMQDIFDIFSSTAEASVAAERVCDILDKDGLYKKENWGTKVVDDLQGDIEFNNVCFGYEKQKEDDKAAEAEDIKIEMERAKLFNNLNFVIKKNSTVAFCGESGQGKSTIAHLICRSYEIHSGEILIGGHNINDLTEDSLRGSLSVVSQNPYIFNDTIAENIRFVKLDATDEEIIRCLEQAQLKSFIDEQKKGIYTKVGENGVQLSGGQKQRLALARCLMKNSNLIILDEATSSLDNNSQAEVKKVLDSLKSTKTIVIIAHRLSTIENCDKIFFLKDHSIYAEGTNKELLKNCPEYRKLYDSGIE